MISRLQRGDRASRRARSPSAPSGTGPPARRQARRRKTTTRCRSSASSVAFFDSTDWPTGEVRRATVAMTYRLARALSAAGEAQQAQVGDRPPERRHPPRPGGRRRPLPRHRDRRADHGAGARPVDHQLDPRAVHGHRARATGRLHAPDQHPHGGSARRAGGLLQPDDRQHREPAADRGREEAAGGGAAHRPPDPDVAAAARTAGHPGPGHHCALRPGARGRRRLLRLLSVGPTAASAC